MDQTADAKVQEQIFDEIRKERARQDAKFGPQNMHPPERWLVILMEEVGEVSNAVLEKDLAGYYTEFVQVAAVAVAALESLSWQLAKDGETHKGATNGKQR